MARTRVLVLLRRGLEPDGWRRRHELGEAWDRTPYGYDLAEGEFDLRWARDHPEGRVGRLVRTAVRRILGFDLVHVWRNRAAVRVADVIWTHTEREHLAVAALKMLGRGRFPARLIAQSVWLWDSWDGFSPVRRGLYRRLLAVSDVELLLSRVNRDFSAERVPGRRVVFVPFGTQGVAAEPTPDAGNGVVLAIGSDRHRDWDLLAEVARRSPDLSFIVGSLSPDVRARPWTTNVSFFATGSVRELTRLYTQASVAVIPLLPNRHASGCTVAIEAMSAGIPLVVTDAGGIDDYVATSTATLVPVGDTAAFGAAIRAALDSRTPATGDARRCIERGLTQADYVERIAIVTRCVVRGDPIDDRVSRFESVLASPGQARGT